MRLKDTGLTAAELKAQVKKYMIETYERMDFVADYAEGIYMYDENGEAYLDFYAGIAVNCLGNCNPKVVKAVQEQSALIMQTFNYPYTIPQAVLSKEICETIGMDKVMYQNSGAEANEAMIKIARKWGIENIGPDAWHIITAKKSFHGRTFGALSVTGNPHYREAFEPMIGNIRFADLNDYDSVLSQVNDRTCAIILETVQGEGGIHPAGEEFLKKLRALCDERDILLILDEIQCGMGRTGTMFAWQRFGVKPDIMTTAKALGCGVPVGAFVMTEKVGAHSLTSGDHGTTYGGNPLAGAAICKVFELYEKENILENVNHVGAYLGKKLEELAEKYDFIEERRGVGLMRGLACSIPVGDIINRALEKGLILINAGTNILRFVPPLVITEQNVDDMIRILTECLDETAAQRK